MNETGTLFMIGIPIGNANDITLRVKVLLEELTVLACEDTRETSHLLKELGVSSRKEFISIFEHGERFKVPKLIQRLKAGEDIGCVVSRGMPVISDPGYLFLREAIRENIPIKVIPGVSAVTTALVASGLPPDKFLFLGFPPRKDQKQRNFFEKYKDLDVTLIFFESPRRLFKTLKNLEIFFSFWNLAICRELTKPYEEVIRGKYSEVSKELEDKEILGEITVVLSLK